LTIGAGHTFGLNFTSKNAAVARKVLQLLKSEGDNLRTEITVRRSRQLNKNNSYTVRAVPSLKVNELFMRIGFLHEDSLNMENDRGILKKQCCRIAYLRGAFQGGGSVNRPEAAYHLELVTGSFELGNLLYDLLRRMGFPAGFVDRKDSYIVYLKEGDAVIDFLGMVEADEAVESFEVARNVKEVREQVNRLVNCETANLQKAVDAAGRQLAMIRALEAQGKFSSLPPKVRAAAKARLENPDATLQELAEMLGISKSGMNHRMRKLKELAETSG
jgi:DNA-binding protein WhiA